MALTTIDDRGLKTPIDLLDNEKIRFGTGNDLEIYHDSNNSVVQNSTGQLYIKSPGGINIDSLSEQYIHCTENADVQLYYDDSKKLETTSSGVTVYTDLVTTGNCSPSADGGGNLGSADYSWYNLFVNNDIHVADNGVIQLGDGNDLQIYHNGSHSYIDENGTGILAIRSNGTEVAIASVSGESMGRFINDGAVELYYDNVWKLKTASNGVHLNDSLFIPDSEKAHFGAGDDLQIYHDGSHSNVENSTGNLHLRSTANCYIQVGDGSGGWENALRSYPSGTVELYYDDAKKFETGSDSVTVTGHLKVGTNDAFDIGTDSTRWRDLYIDNAIDIKDNGIIRMGDSDDLQIYHDGNNNYIVAGQSLFIKNDYEIQFLTTSNEKQLVTKANGASELYYDDAKKFETHSTGAKISSGAAAILKLVSNPSYSASIEFGDTDDDDEAQIWYDNYGKTFNFRTSEASDLVFYRDGTERTRITSTGTETAGYNKSFLVKSDSAFGSTSAHVLQSNNNDQVATIIEHSGDTSPYGLVISFSDDDPDNTTNYFLKCEDSSNTNRIFIYSDGDVWNHDNNYTGSDQTLKENIVDATPKLEDLKKLKVRNFNWKADYFPEKSKKKQLGFIAQEVEEVFPSLVSEHDIAGGLPGDDHTPVIKKAIKQAWDPIIIKAMQELIEKVETLETEVAALKAK